MIAADMMVLAGQVVENNLDTFGCYDSPGFGMVDSLVQVELDTGLMSVSVCHKLILLDIQVHDNNPVVQLVLAFEVVVAVVAVRLMTGKGKGTDIEFVLQS